MLIQYQDLDLETLYNLIESFLLREGTDYGELEVPLSQKREAALVQLKQGKLLILYSELHESVTLISKSQFEQQQ